MSGSFKHPAANTYCRRMIARDRAAPATWRQRRESFLKRQIELNAPRRWRIGFSTADRQAPRLARKSGALRVSQHLQNQPEPRVPRCFSCSPLLSFLALYGYVSKMARASPKKRKAERLEAGLGHPQGVHSLHSLCLSREADKRGSGNRSFRNTDWYIFADRYLTLIGKPLRCRSRIAQLSFR